MSQLLGGLRRGRCVALVSFAKGRKDMVCLGGCLSIVFGVDSIVVSGRRVTVGVRLPVRMPRRVAVRSSTSIDISRAIASSRVAIAGGSSYIPSSRVGFVIRGITRLLSSRKVPYYRYSGAHCVLSPLSTYGSVFGAFALGVVYPCKGTTCQFRLSMDPKSRSTRGVPTITRPSTLGKKR